MAGSFRYLETSLSETIKALELMHCQMEYRLTPLPELCSILRAGCGGTTGKVFDALGHELSRPDAEDVQASMKKALSLHPELPELCGKSLERLSITLGKTDLMTQLQGIKLETELLQKELQNIQKEQPARLKSYRTLGICCGIALAILLL
jgi:stage III sporulation protein AB